MSDQRGYFVPVVMRVTEVRTVMVDLGELDDYGMPPWVPGEPIDMDNLDGFGELWAEGADAVDMEEATAEFAEHSDAAHPCWVVQGPTVCCPHCGRQTDPGPGSTFTYHWADRCIYPHRIEGHPDYLAG